LRREERGERREERGEREVWLCQIKRKENKYMTFFSFSLTQLAA
jgi:hypothetical protein